MFLSPEPTEKLNAVVEAFETPAGHYREMGGQDRIISRVYGSVSQAYPVKGKLS